MMLKTHVAFFQTAKFHRATASRPRKRCFAWGWPTLLLVPLAVVPGPCAAKNQAAVENRAEDGPQASARADIVTQEATCRWAAHPPKLDGKLDDACWREAAAVERFASYWDGTARPGTRAYLVWDDEAIYYAATMDDQELRSFGARRNDRLWDGDVFEMFLKPREDRPAYYEFQANPRELVFECFFPERGKGPADLRTAPRLGNTAAVELRGTLDRPGDRDQGWTVEGRIPWSAFGPTGGKPRSGAAWRFALCRYDHGPAGTMPVLMSSAPLTRPSFHRHEDYGRLRFEGPRP